MSSRRNPTDEFIEKGMRPGDEFQVGKLDPRVTLAPIQRVAMFAESFLPKIDGVSKTAVLVARHLQQTGREVLIFAPDNNGNTPSSLGGSRVVSMPALGMPFAPETKMAIPTWEISRIMDDFKPDMIQLFSPAVLSVAGVLFGKNHRVPLIANYQTDLPGYAARYGMHLFKAPLRESLRVMHNRAHLNLAPTHTVIRQLKEWGFRRLRLWGRGADRHRLTPDRRSDEMRSFLLNGRPENSLLVIYVGRLAPEKRVDLLRDVAQTEGIALTVIGDGASRAELEKMFGEQAFFTGYLFGDDLAAAYASADVFAFTGTNETFGQVVMEAMTAGLPVLVPNAGGVVDLVLDGMNGYICQEDPGDFQRKVIYMRDNPDHRQRMATHAREYALSRPWETLMAELEDYYWEAWRLNERLIQASRTTELRMID